MRGGGTSGGVGRTGSAAAQRPLPVRAAQRGRARLAARVRALRALRAHCGGQ